MKFSPLFFFGILVILISACQPKEKPMSVLVDEQLRFCMKQYREMDKSLPVTELPRSYDAKAGKMVTSNSGWWCSGFFPGSLWYLYEYSGDTAFREMALRRTSLLENEKTNKGTHDLGFMLYCSYGNGLRICQPAGYTDVLTTGAKSLSTRFNQAVGCIRSWDHNKWMYPVIIDNMMNLEFLFWATRQTGDSAFAKIAVSHADVTMKNHFRNDNSSWHVVDYDTITGIPREKVTAQGFSNESAWSRGQSWGLYGYTMMYRETRDKKYLEQAEKIAAFILENPNLPEDLIPYWDFNAPGIPDEPRDVSAAAIMCSALIELSGYSSPEKNALYLATASTLLRNLSSPAYRAGKGQNGNFILMHSVGSIPHKSEVDVPLSYADYYFIESLLRMKKAVSEAKV